MSGTDGPSQRGEVDARRGDVGAIKVVVDAEALHAGLRPSGEIGAILRDERLGAVAHAVHTDPREDFGAELNRRRPQGLRIGQRTERVTLAIIVSARSPDGVSDFVQKAEDVIGTDRAVMEPALRGSAVVELEGVIDAEGDGERRGILAEEFAGVAGADLGCAGIVEVWVRVERVALRLDRLAVDHREEHRLFLPDLPIEDAVEAVGEFRGATVTDGESPVGG